MQRYVSDTEIRLVYPVSIKQLTAYPVYCCGNNTACCNIDSTNLRRFYNNPAPVPSASASLSDYHAGLQLSTQSRSNVVSRASSSGSQDRGTTSSSSQTALTPSSAASIVLSPSPTTSSTTSSASQMALTSSSAASIHLLAFRTTSSTTFSRFSSSQSLNRPNGIYHNGKTAIEVAVPVAIILIAAFAT